MRKLLRNENMTKQLFLKMPLARYGISVLEPIFLNTVSRSLNKHICYLALKNAVALVNLSPDDFKDAKHFLLSVHGVSLS